MKPHDWSRWLSQWYHCGGCNTIVSSKEQYPASDDLEKDSILEDCEAQSLVKEVMGGLP